MEKIKKNEDIILAGLFVYLLLTSFISQSIYAVMSRYASLAVFIVLFILLIPHAGTMLEKRDLKAALAALTGILAMINLIIIGSAKGAVLIPSDLVLISLSVFYISLRRKVKLFISAAGSILTIIWYITVRWEYNFNMAGLTFMLFMMMGVIFLEYLKKEKGYDYLTAGQILMYVTAFIYATLYHSRCAMAGILAFGLCILLRKLLTENRIFFTVMLILTTAGSIFFTIVYVILGSRGVRMTFLYKDLLSGRQQIWKELWAAFLRQPYTGIGSSYELKSFEIFEVHNGLFDILTVHGIIVFFFVLILICAALNASQMGKADGDIKGLALAALFGMLLSSFFENFFTVPPYSVFFLCFMLFCRQDKEL